MANNDTQRLLESLEKDWGGFAYDYFHLPPGQRKDFLSTQGYPTFSSLVAHITAWWERATVLITNFRNDPFFKPQAVDVHAFNEHAITGWTDRSEEEALASFEEQRQRMIALVNGLIENDLADSRISRQLEIELIGHYNEHRIEKPAVD